MLTHEITLRAARCVFRDMAQSVVAGRLPNNASLVNSLLTTPHYRPICTGARRGDVLLRAGAGIKPRDSSRS